MSLDLNEITYVAQAILDRLGNTQWMVIDATPTEVAEFGEPGKSLESPRTILVRATSTTDESTMISAYFVLGIPTQQAIMQLASSLQDEAIEHLRAAVPKCPAHPHPLTPRIDRNRAGWVCPQGVAPTYPISDID